MKEECKACAKAECPLNPSYNSKPKPACKNGKCWTIYEEIGIKVINHDIKSANAKEKKEEKDLRDCHTCLVANTPITRYSDEKCNICDPYGSNWTPIPKEVSNNE